MAALLPAENDAASAAQLADRYFATASWKAFRPTTTETAKDQAEPLEYFSSELSTDSHQGWEYQEHQRSEPQYFGSPPHPLSTQAPVY